jgi:dihydroorotase
VHIVRKPGGVIDSVTMIKPADMHQHVRQGAMLKLVAPMVARRFYAAIIMPNTVPPITTAHMMSMYFDEIETVLRKERRKMQLLMTMYLTDTLGPVEVLRALDLGLAGVKYYPRGLTTNSDSGVADPVSLWTPGTSPYEVLGILADRGAVLLLHAADGFDTKGTELDPYDQEEHFMMQTLPRIVDAHPDLKISVEHLSTATGADKMRHYGKSSNGRIGCSLTAHHQLLDRRDLFRGGYRPHRDWRPVIQPSEHTQELRRLASEDLSFVWLGSDSAPHPRAKKESDCCASGVLMAHAGIELYAEAFDAIQALDNRFERFASINGPRFYGIEPSTEQISLIREPWTVPPMFIAQEEAAPKAGGLSMHQEIIPFRQGEKIEWKLV